MITSLLTSYRYPHDHCYKNSDVGFMFNAYALEENLLVQIEPEVT